MSDIVAQIEVLAQETGCLIDLSAVLDLAVCPKVDLKMNQGHRAEERDDYICVTPTNDRGFGYNKKQKRCADHSCYEVHDQVCRKNHVDMDMKILVILGLLTEEQLERYLKTTGQMDEDDHFDMDNDNNVMMDPLLSLGLGEDDSILDAEVLGEKGLLNVDLGENEGLLNLGGDGPLLDLGGKGEGLLGLGGTLRRRSHGGLDGIDELANVQVGGESPREKAPINVEALTHSRRQKDGLLDANVGGEPGDGDAAINLDLLTNGQQNDNGFGSGGFGNGGNGFGNGNGNGFGNGDHGDHYMSHYQPMCQQGFRPEHRDHAESCHARDVNHCLAICHSKGALLTLDANAQVGDVAEIQLCAAIEFDQSQDGDNCRYFVAPEHEPCHDDQLEHNENCYTFVRN